VTAPQIRVALAGIEPAVWRRLVVPWTWNLGELHLVLQAAFNWHGDHLHEFHIGGLRYGDPMLLEDGAFVDNLRVFDECEARLVDFGRKPGTTFTYHYDFGDHWHQLVEIEQCAALDVVPQHASCTDGARATPPEDVGGVGGYETFLAIMADPDHPEHAHMKRWCGGHFDPEWFDLTLTDKDVRNALRPNVRRRLHQPRPKRPKPSS